MNICLITGSSGLIGSESVAFFADKFDKIIGIDNNMRQVFFGPDASTERNTEKLIREVPNFEHYAIDIRNVDELEKLFSKYIQISSSLSTQQLNQATTGQHVNH